MKQTKLSSKLYPIIRAVAASAVLPVLFIYIMIAKPDYAIMNALSHVVVPVAQTIGDIITWPIRAAGNMINNVTELSTLRTENEELRTRLDQALANKNACDIAIAENKKLNKELNIINAQPRDTIIADIVQNNTVLGHNTYIVNRGNQDGIKKGMAVTNTDMTLVGIIIDVADNFSRVRALTDADINIAVRIVGSDVYGFMTGNGSKRPDIGLFSDPEFQPTDGLKLVSSNISGVLPAGLFIGEIINKNDVKVIPPNKLSRVMILKFDSNKKEYK